MRYILTAASFALLGTLAGCEAPLDAQDFGPAEVSDDAAFEADGSSSSDHPFDDEGGHHQPVHGAGHGTFTGHLVWPRTGAIGGAKVCVEGAPHCGSVFEDGGFAVHGLHAGVSETVVVRAPGFVTLIVPLDLQGDGHRRMDLTMVREDPNSRPTSNGSIRFRTWSMAGYARPIGTDVNWYAFDEEGESVGKATGPKAQLDDVRQGTYDVRYASRSPLMCARTSGWDGADANAITVPVRAGAITYVEQSCIELSLD